MAGVVAGVSSGSATITATSEGKSGSATVSVTSVPVVAFASVTTGGAHTCALTASGAAYNARGQLGDGTTTPRSGPVAVMGGHTFQRIAAGGFSIGHTCALTVGGDAYCWGDNERGQLGGAVADLTAHPEPVRATGGVTFTALAAGLGRHTCGLTGTGTAYCWGDNSFGALGNGTVQPSSVPVLVNGGLVLTQVIAGGFIGHTCGLTAGGAAHCWGENEVGALGIGSTVDRLEPAAVAGGLSFASLDAGFRHTCGRATNGAVYCWGSGGAGQLGINSTSAVDVPTKVVGQP